MSNHQQLCTFWVDRLYLGVEVEKVQEVLRFQEMTPVPLAHPVVSGLINLRGQIVTAMDLRRRLDLPPAPGDTPPLNVVLRDAGGAVSLLVDEIGDVVEVDRDSLERPPQTLRGVIRTYVRAISKLQQNLLLVLDAEKVLSLSNNDR